MTRPNFNIAAVALFALSAISLLPLLTIYWEFRGIPFCNEAYWAYIAKFYGSYFLFPIFGILVAAFLIIPCAVFAAILRDKRHRSVLAYVVGFWVGLIAIASAIEFTGSPNALFDASPKSIASDDGKVFFDHFKTICSDQFAYKNHYDLYQTELHKAATAGPSLSGYVYYLAVPAQIALLAAVLSVFFLIIYFRKTFIEGYLSQARLRWEANNFFLLYGMALIVGSIWCLYRISYRVDNNSYFGANNNLLADYLVFGLYFLIVAIYIVFAGFDMEKLAKTGSQLSSALAVIGLSLTAPSGIIVYFFGLKASLQNFFAILVALLILVAVGLIFNAPPPKLSHGKGA
jgi:hypothetical protein